MKNTLSEEIVVASSVEYTAGEKAALAQNKDIVTLEQMAVCYIVARNKAINENHIVNFGINIGADISVEIGMHPETYRRFERKFWGIETGQHEDEKFTNSEVIYKKVLKTSEEFSKMEYAKVFELAKNAFTEDAKIKGEIKRNDFLDKQKKYAADKKKNDQKIEFVLRDRFNGAKVKMGADKAEKWAIKKTAKEFDKKVSEIKSIFKSFFN